MNARSLAGVAGLLTLVAGAATAPPLAAGRRSGGERESKAPSPAAKGEAYQWKAANGIPFEYFVPKNFDPKVGANLVLILHGNGLSYAWGLANHPPGQFLPDDVVVSPEGPTFLQSTNAWEFLDSRDDCVKVHELIEELKKVFKVRATFLYGHSQGSFFVFRYAGEFPDDVNGVVGHAGALWATSKLGKSGHKQAIAFLHGTDDANVHWWQSADARMRYRDADYPNVHLRTLWSHPHAPVWQQAQNELAWCEGMTSDDPARVAASLSILSEKNVPYGVDFAALFDVARRLESMAGATAAQRSAATRAKGAVDKHARAIAAAIDQSLGKGKLSKVDGKPWLGLAQRFLEDFDRVDGCAAWSKAHAQELAAVDTTAEESGREFGQLRAKERAKALVIGLDVLEKGWRQIAATDIAATLEPWVADEKGSGLNKKDAARAKAVLEAWKKGRAEGFEAYEKAVKAFDL